MAELEAPNNNLQDFWKTLWHVDVRKDHTKEYDQNIVNQFLPVSTYVTSFSCTNSPLIARQGVESGLNPSGSSGGIVNKTHLFDCLVSNSTFNYNILYDIAQGNKEAIPVSTIINLNPLLVGPNQYYVVSSFALNGNGLNNFIDSPIGLYVDVALNIRDLISTYNGQSQASNKLYYAYTREIQSDPAKKITYETIIGKSVEERAKWARNVNNYYYELKPPLNRERLIYPEFTPDNPMSYFYCKYPVILEYTKLHEYNFTLGVKLLYTSNYGNIVVPEGANEAGASTKTKTAQLAVFNKYSDSIQKQAIFISKHHGDVAQALAMYRNNIKLGNPPENPPIRTITSQNYKPAFVSYDVLAITKALTFGCPYIFMYFKKEKDSEIQSQSKKRRGGGDKRKRELNDESESIENNRVIIFKKLPTDGSFQPPPPPPPPDYISLINNNINEYNNRLVDISNNIPNYIRVVKSNIEGYVSSGDDVPTKYKNILRRALNIAVLLSQLPTERIDLIPEDAPRDLIRDKQLIIKYNEIKTLKELTTRLLETFISYEREGNQRRIKGYRISFLSMEKEIFIDLEEYINNSRIEILDGAKDSIESINLKYVWGRRNIQIVPGQALGQGCRVTTQMNSSWGLDLIRKIYLDLSIFDERFKIQLNNEKISNYIIQKLLQVLDTEDRHITFNNGLQFIGILAQSPIQGGARTVAQLRQINKKIYNKTIRKLNNTTMVRTTQKNVSATKENRLFYNGLAIELNDIISHCEYILESIILYEYINTLSKTDYQRIGKLSLANFMNKVYGKFEKQNNSKNDILIGGFDRLSEFTQMINEAIRIHPAHRIVENDQAPTEEIIFDPPHVNEFIRESSPHVIESEELSDEIKSRISLYSKYSVIFQYKQIVELLLSDSSDLNRLLGLISRVPIGQSAIGRERHIQSIKNKLINIRELLDQIEEVYTEQEIELENENDNIPQSRLGGNRRIYRKFKTYKKSKRVQKSTLKRLK
jgi:hypothetical protein